MLEARQLACLRGERLLFRRLDFTVRHGELLRLIGPNGVGKTSLLRMLCGLMHIEAGELLWQGQPMAAQREAFHADLLYIGHAPALHELLTPLENLRFAASLMNAPADEARCSEALVELGLARQLELPCKLLSQGQRRRVALARLWLGATQKLWILDEPFTALDVAAVDALARRIDHHLSHGGAVIFTSHQDVNFIHPVRQLDLWTHIA
ncbi:cytochrome c biogenesis heme-transporting ATPase CcmA [Viridibacterium curvum]|uniref:Cytochrome c biogenesis heme-transporting ATPase CcmA n=1 Tax=Viridibacterium curvum TaxID=1101404 RepID=A0ABP9R4I3_9RHOO